MGSRAVTADARLRRLKWRCRRGMKELDVLLERFVQRNGTHLAAGGWPELEALLDTEDDQLWRWLADPSANACEPFRPLLERIRDGSA